LGLACCRVIGSLTPGRWLCVNRFLTCLGLLEGFRQFGHTVGPDRHRDRRPTEVVADRLECSSQVLCQERLGHRIKRKPVLRPGKAVAFVREEDVGDRDVFSGHRADDLIRFDLSDPRIVGPLADEEGPIDAIDPFQRRTFHEHLTPLVGRVVVYWGNFEVAFDACLRALIVGEAADGGQRKTSGWERHPFRQRCKLFRAITEEWLAAWRTDVASQLLAIVDAASSLQARRNMIAHAGDEDIVLTEAGVRDAIKFVKALATALEGEVSGRLK